MRSAMANLTKKDLWLYLLIMQGNTYALAAPDFVW